MAGLTKSELRLIGIGVAVGALAVPVLQLLRVLTTSMATRFNESDGAQGDGVPVRRAGNIINICIMGMMATTKVSKVLPGVHAQAGKKGEVSATEQSHSSSLSRENWRL